MNFDASEELRTTAVAITTGSIRRLGLLNDKLRDPEKPPYGSLNAVISEMETAMNLLRKVRDVEEDRGR